MSNVQYWFAPIRNQLGAMQSFRSDLLPASVQGCDAEIIVDCSPTAPDFFSIFVCTPEARYTFGDYPTLDEAFELALHLVDSRTAWLHLPVDPWRPSVWQERIAPRGGRGYWRRGLEGSTLSTWRPHGTYWRMYWWSSPIVRSHADRGIFDSPWEAMDALDALAANGMRGALLD
jgi:hypothetical protein